MNCAQCGTENDPAGAFCVSCGAALDAPAAPAPEQPAAAPQQPTPAPQPPMPAPEAAPPPKKRGCMRIGCVMMFIVPLLLLCVLFGWIGWMPGLSRLIGPEPRDLGVELSVPMAYEGSAALNVPDTYTDVEKLQSDPDAFSTFNAQLTSDQASSLLLMGQDEIPNWPFEFVQLRFNGDGTAEASGVLDFEDLGPFLTGNLGVPEDSVAEMFSEVMLNSDTTFYVKGTANVQNNAVNMSVSEIQLGRFTVPGGWYQGQEHVGADYISSALDREGFAIENLDHAGGTMNAVGSRPPSSLIPWLGIAQDDRVEGITP